ncbi:protein DMR6-LIKE OXYGENASE 2-like [Papaver somniferum]|uniref:protein DMR6-LIKE OXYGENASE 2-like n=1 Tax=Papaver somniferum TaxID=3469 RepID=UPI000E6FF270|nr:protein DMR6-LIKE OXYGENASE 2-like [Papaver somniferum]
MDVDDSDKYRYSESDDNDYDDTDTLMADLLTYGLPGHTDPNAITILLQDDVPGSQVLRDGKWIAVHPIPNTFIINIGDQIQAISNDKYKSVLHRAVVNCDKERFSIPTFCCPSKEAVIGPASQLVDDEHPSLYKDFTYTEYFGTKNLEWKVL